MELIEDNCDKTVTKCGHLFHSSCIFQNMAAHNGFGCPYCRTTLAVESEDSDEDSYYSTTYDLQQEEYVLSSFRMFHQRINDEEIEEDTNNVFIGEEGYDDEEEERENENKTNHLVEFLNNKGITYKDLVRYVLVNFEESYYDNAYYDHVSSVVYGQIRAGMSRYERASNNNNGDPVSFNNNN
jgi:transcription elongation factor Elf1